MINIHEIPSQLLTSLHFYVETIYFFEHHSFIKKPFLLFRYNSDRLITVMQQQMIKQQQNTNTGLSDSMQVLAIKRTDITTAPQVIANFQHMRIEYVNSTIPPRTVKTTPAFNQDRFYFTPAFMLEEDLLRLHRNPENLKLFQNLHQGKLAQASLQQGGETIDEEEILIPRPSASKFCHVCRGTYDDYLNHTRMPYHIANIQKNKFSIDINRLCDRFSALPAKKGKSKQINKRENCKRIRGKADILVNSDELTLVSIKA